MGLFGRRKHARIAPTQGIPTDAETVADAFMQIVLLMVTFSPDDDRELEKRQCAAACAFGALDWYCQAKGYKFDELTWMTESSAFMLRYMCHADPGLPLRVGPEVVGEKLAEAHMGKGPFLKAIMLGASAMKAMMMDNDKNAPLACTRLIQSVGRDEELA